ncbi:MAG: cobaltochelatase subunit CobT [SAR86 cluster bacterium]|jgi:cobaltochelatase CobT|nr:cobaltochelatase subunit CobT [SAR86 cluster bacterium]
MSGNSNSNESVKDAVASTIRAIAKDPNLEINFGGLANNTKNSISFPNPPTLKNKLPEFRGNADAVACAKRYRNEQISVDTGSLKINNLLIQLEDIRVEILGSKNFNGIQANLKKRYEKKCIISELDNDQEEALPIALEGWLRQLLLHEKSSKATSKYLDPWKNIFNSKGSIFKKELENSLESQVEFSEVARKLLHALEIEDKILEENEIQESDPQQSEEDNSEDNSEEEEGSSENNPSEEIENEEEMQEGESDEMGAENFVDDLENSSANHSWLEQLVQQQNNFTYKVFTREFDEEIDATDLCTSEELNRLRKHLDQLMGPSKSTISKLANRLQRLLMAQQNRSWEFNKEEGILDSSRLHKIILDPVSPLTYKVEKDTEFRDTVVSILVDSSGSMRGRSMTVAAISADIISTTLERCNVKTEVLGFTTSQWKGGESRKLWTESGKGINPGRLNDLRHIIFKSADTPWRRGHKNFGLMLREGLLKENVDGEALIWAHDRLIKRHEQRKILMVISDGAPVDDSTLSTNPTNYLDMHLRQVINSIENNSPVNLIAIGIGHDVTRYYKKAVTIHRAEELGGVMLDQLTNLFSQEE